VADRRRLRPRSWRNIFLSAEASRAIRLRASAESRQVSGMSQHPPTDRRPGRPSILAAADIILPHLLVARGKAIEAHDHE
jgi:hypothetical protein